MSIKAVLGLGDKKRADARKGAEHGECCAHPTLAKLEGPTEERQPESSTIRNVEGIHYRKHRGLINLFH